MIILSWNYHVQNEWMIGFFVSFVGFYVVAFLVEHKRLENEIQKKFKAHRVIFVLSSVIFTLTTWCQYAFSLSSVLLQANSNRSQTVYPIIKGDTFLLENKCSIENAAISILVAFSVAQFCFILSSKDQFFSSTNDQRVEILRSLYTNRSTLLSIKELKKKSKRAVRFEALCRRCTRHLLSGALISAVQVFMRVLMFRNRSDSICPQVTLHWLRLFCVWCAGALLSSLGIWTYFRMLSWKRYEWLRVSGAALLWTSSVLTEVLSLSCISFTWSESLSIPPSSPVSKCNYMTRRFSLFLPVFAVVSLICLGSALLMVFELRVNYHQLTNDFSKLVNLMDAAYVSGHATHNFERSFENFINAALPLMAAHTKRIEVDFEDFDISNRKTSESIINMTRQPARLPEKLMKLLGPTAESAAKNCISIASTMRLHKEKSRVYADRPSSKNLIRVSSYSSCGFLSARQPSARSVKERKVPPPLNILLIDDCGDLGNPRTNRLPGIFESKPCTPPSHREDSIISIKSNQQSQTPVEQMSPSNSYRSSASSAKGQTYKRVIQVSDEKKEEENSPRVTIQEKEQEDAPSQVTLSSSRKSYRPTNSACRTKPDVIRLVQHESLLEKIARYQNTDMRRQKTSAAFVRKSPASSRKSLGLIYSPNMLTEPSPSHRSRMRGSLGMAISPTNQGSFKAARRFSTGNTPIKWQSPNVFSWKLPMTHNSRDRELSSNSVTPKRFSTGMIYHKSSIQQKIKAEDLSRRRSSNPSLSSLCNERRSSLLRRTIYPTVQEQDEKVQPRNRLYSSNLSQDSSVERRSSTTAEPGQVEAHPYKSDLEMQCNTKPQESNLSFISATDLPAQHSGEKYYQGPDDRVSL